MNVSSLEEAPARSPARPRRARSPLRALRELDRVELLLLAVLVLLSMWTLGLELGRSLADGLVWTGSENFYQADGMQSMMWIEGIARHGASPDLYVLARTSTDYFQPLLGLSAGLTALGLAPYLALLLWKPVALVAVFVAVRAYVHRTLAGTWARRAALALALFFAWSKVIGDSWIVFWTWGYPFALIGLACSIAALVGYARARAVGRVGVLVPLFALLASWCHPWQGETLILVLLGCELVMLLGGRRPRLAPLALTVGAAALPLLYFAALVHFDPVWSRERAVALTSYPLSDVFAFLAPLAIPALLAYRIRPRNFLELSARVWPFAAAADFALSEWKGSGSTHALLGVTVPLAVLAVEGIRSLSLAVAPRRAPLAAAVIAVVLAATVPGTVHMLKSAAAVTTPRHGRSDYLTHGESAAFGYLRRDPRQGGVLTSFDLGMVLPTQTGRATYVGNCFWSEPGCELRSQHVEALLAGRLDAVDARRFVRSTGASFVLAGCGSADLRAALAPIASSMRRFGCATVYVLG